MDEFWRLLADPAFETFAKDGPKTWRKLNAVMALATQSASDVLDSPISRTIIEQTPTKILFPNPDANEAEYVEGFGLSEREFKLIKEQLEPGSRQFLVKQGHYSVVCQLDLKGFDAELKVISGRASSVEASAANHGRSRPGARTMATRVSFIVTPGHERRLVMRVSKQIVLIVFVALLGIVPQGAGAVGGCRRGRDCAAHRADCDSQAAAGHRP